MPHCPAVRYATRAVVLVWLVLMFRLMIADLWDETNGMVIFSDPSLSFSRSVEVVATQSIGLWRPLSILPAVAILHFVPDYAVSWRVLRILNMAFLLGAFALLGKALKHWNGALTERDRFVFTAAALFSGSTIITATWYANICDASAFFMLAWGIWWLARGRAWTAGVIFGAAFFFKESAALIFPLLVVLVAARRVAWRDALRAAIPAFALGALYFVLRAQIIPFGGNGDFHGFELRALMPTIATLGQTFWYQSVKAGPWVIFGGAFTLLSIAALRRPLVIASVIAFFAAMVVVYWGMFDHVQTEAIGASNFVGRLFLIPVMLVLFILALERKTWAVCILLIPILLGGAITYRDHARMQRLYKKIYRTARETHEKPLTVYYPVKPLDDRVRGIRIGDFPDAPWRIDAKRGRAIPNDRSPY